MKGVDLWSDGLICAFELVRGRKRMTSSKSSPKLSTTKQTGGSEAKKKHDEQDNSKFKSSERGGKYHCCSSDHLQNMEDFLGSYWMPIGWDRITELVQTVQFDLEWASQSIDWTDKEGNATVADVAAPYWERHVGPSWWCHVQADHPFIRSWLSSAQWLHPAISIALLDESRLISERMKHLFYEVPVRVAGGLLFELLGQSAGDPYVNEDDIPIVVRSWQALNFLITSLHVKGSAKHINVLGIAEVQEMLDAGGCNIPRSTHEIIAHLVGRLARWDDRLFRKNIFGSADEIELMFMNRRTHEDLQLFSIILNQEIRRLSTQVIRVKWSFHVREEIVFELLQHLKGTAAKGLLESVRKSTREMIEEQEVVWGRLFTIQDVMQSAVRAWLQDKSLTVSHNLGVFGGCGLVLSIITGLFGINVNGIPGSEESPYAFALFSVLLVVLGGVLIVIGLVYLRLKKPNNEEDVEVRKMELQELVRMFQQDAESHAQVSKTVTRNNVPPTAADLISANGGYIFLSVEHLVI